MVSNSSPVVLLGIDGAAYSILDPLIAEGKLPSLSRLKQEGASGVLRSTIHPLTPAAWVSMVTGVNPGKHGVYDFRRRKAGSYDWELVNSRSWSGEPVWSVLGRQGRRVGIFNMPMTYPPHSVNGFMVSGLGTPPQSQSFVYPSSLSAKFRVNFPTYAVDPEVATEDLNEYLYRCDQSAEQRLKAIRFLRREYPNLDFFMPVFIETDRVHHVFWRFLDPSMSDYYDEPLASTIREQIVSIYQKIDVALEELWTWVAERQGYVFVVSDHGFGPLLKDVYMNKWLIDQGYLTLTSNLASDAGGHFFDQVDWDNTRAYSFGFFGNINLNLRGREPRGVVQPGREAEVLKHEIITRLLQLADLETDEIIVDSVHRKEDLYSGIYLDQAPDLLVVMKDYAYMTRDGFDFNSDQLMGPPMEYNKHILPHSGNHRLEGIVLIAGEGIKPGSEICGSIITDIAPTVLYAAGAQIPAGLDGQVLVSAFDETFVAERRPIYESFEINRDSSYKPSRLQLLEKDVQLSLLDDELRRLQLTVAEQRQTIHDMEEVIRRFQEGRIMRFLAWLQRMKPDWLN
jgi:predicted AlkP superfamily phosphohydrolase/phosphomutase